MGLFIQILTFILIISILVVLHELGHFLPAKYFKTKVEKFYLFFNPWFSIFKKKIGETEYGIGWLPFGGYVKIAGMIDESMDKEQMKLPPKPWEFRSKPAWQRLIIMLGGIIVNVILAWVIYAFLLGTYGDSYIPVNGDNYDISFTKEAEQLGFKTGDKIIAIDGEKPERLSTQIYPGKVSNDLMLDFILGDQITIERDGKEETLPITDEAIKKVFKGVNYSFFDIDAEPFVNVSKESNAYKQGLRSGDKIISLNNQKISKFKDISKALENKSNDTLNISFERNNQIQNKIITLKDGKIGVSRDVQRYIVTDKYGFLSSIPAGFKQTFKTLDRHVKQFKVIFKPKTEAYKQLKGPIGITKIMPKAWDWGFFWNFLAMFSIWLAFVNILPIPALDGGHAMFLIYEIISGRPPSEKVLERGQLVGFVIVMTIMVLVIGNDIWNLF